MQAGRRLLGLPSNSPANIPARPTHLLFLIDWLLGLLVAAPLASGTSPSAPSAPGSDGAGADAAAGDPPNSASIRNSERPRISSSARQTYSPNTPIATRLIPPTNKTTVISELQPSTGAPRK